jgi:hypothetical protein
LSRKIAFNSWIVVGIFSEAFFLDMIKSPNLF